MTFIQKFSKNLNPTDIVVLGFYIFLTVLNLIFHSRIDTWPVLVGLNCLLFLLVFWIAHKDNSSHKKLWEIIHYYYVVPLIFLTFKQVYVLIRALHTVDYDDLLISADRFLFGGDPTVFLYQFSTPIITEILQIAYGTFFFLPLILGIEYHLKKDYEKLNFIIFSVVFGFFLSYIGYFFLPSVGPRFTLHTFETTNMEIPGLFLTNFLREIVNAGESIPSGTLNPMEVVQRDVFPSGHTQMTLIVMFLAVKFRSKNRLFFLIDGSLLIFATVYLRYHYVVDLIGGLVFMIMTMVIGKHLFNWWNKKINKPIFKYDRNS